jgi:hypothetical protein
VTELKPSIPILFFADEILGIQPYDWVPNSSELRSRTPDRGGGRQLQWEDFHSVSDLRVVDPGQLPDRPHHVLERHREPG